MLELCTRKSSSLSQILADDSFLWYAEGFKEAMTKMQATILNSNNYLEIISSFAVLSLANFHVYCSVSKYYSKTVIIVEYPLY